MPKKPRFRNATETENAEACETINKSYGPAFNQVFERLDGTLWVHNGEYASQVNYCPVTGKRAKVQIEPWPDDEGYIPLLKEIVEVPKYTGTERRKWRRPIDLLHLEHEETE